MVSQDAVILHRLQGATFSSAPFPSPPLRLRCLHRCWSLHKSRWSLGPDSCAGAFLHPGTDNRNIWILASTTFKKRTNMIRHVSKKNTYIRIIDYIIEKTLLTSLGE